MLTCKDASQLMSQALDRRLGLFEKAGLRFHLVLCHNCHRAYRQLDYMHRLCKRIAAGSDDITALQPGLSADAQERILKELRRKLGEHSPSGD